MKSFVVLRFGLSLAAILGLYAFCLFAVASVALLPFYFAAVKQDVVLPQQPHEFLGISLPADEESERIEDMEANLEEEGSYLP